MPIEMRTDLGGGCSRAVPEMQDPPQRIRQDRTLMTAREGSGLGAKAVDTQGNGGVFTTKAVETPGTGSVSPAKAVETQCKGSVLTPCTMLCPPSPNEKW